VASGHKRHFPNRLHRQSPIGSANENPRLRTAASAIHDPADLGICASGSTSEYGRDEFLEFPKQPWRMAQFAKTRFLRRASMSGLSNRARYQCNQT